jgi:hypothetical protein
LFSDIPYDTVFAKPFQSVRVIFVPVAYMPGLKDKILKSSMKLTGYRIFLAV